MVGEPNVIGDSKETDNHEMKENFRPGGALRLSGFPMGCLFLIEFEPGQCAYELGIWYKAQYYVTYNMNSQLLFSGFILDLVLSV